MSRELDSNAQVSIREYVDLLFRAHDREHQMTHETLRNQASEYARRLSELNGAHELARRTLNTYVPREAYEQQSREFRERLDRMDRSDSELNGRFSILSVVLTVGMVAITILVNVTLHFVGR